MEKIVLSLGLLGLLWSQTLFAADSVWRDIQSSTSTALNKQLSQDISQGQQLVVPRHLTSFRKLSLDETQLKYNLQSSDSQAGNALGKSSNSNPVIPLTMEIPLPKGDLIRVSLEPTQLLSPKLAAKYPAIKTWKVKGVDDDRISGRIDFTNYGFHAMLMMPDGDTVFVERADRNLEGTYNSFSKQANAGSFKQGFQCDLHDNHGEENNSPVGQPLKRAAERQAESLLSYDLVVAATAEYTRYHGSVSNAMSAIATTINRVNQINERDLSITFDLVDTLIYTDPDRDPYTNDDSQSLLIENIITMEREVGASNFDIGHVFSQGNPSGLALLGSACHDNTYFSDGGLIPGAKAGGVTGSPTPNGDAFDVDFVAHEFGHQLGGKHTFNSETVSCGGGNRTGESAVEPGSGSTIMAYAGICGINDLQSDDSGSSDDYYHTKSITEIFAYTRVDSIGTSCGSRTNSSNNNPEPDAKQDTVIPARTPFILIGSASDPEGDTLTHTWDQMDTGKASNVGVDTGDNALIRSLPPSPASTRFVPRLNDIFQNRFIKGETLPTTNRDLNFAFIVRDGKGGIEFDDVKLNVADKGQAFALASHGISRNLGVNQTTEVSWNVAGTNTSPINCSAVDISLIQSNGNRVSVESNTPNDGNETVTIPLAAQGMSAARMMVACHRPASTFFNIANGNLTIVGSGQGQADSSDNNGVGSSDNSGNGSTSSSGGGALNSLHLLFLLLMLVVSWKRRNESTSGVQS